MNILAISGSLRPTSTISTFLRATIALAPTSMAFTIYDGLGDLPHFAPDLTDTPTPPVVNLREMLQVADGVLMCTPEYAYSMPGALKNAFEWTVSSGEFVGKPVAAMSASPFPTGGERALASLVLTLTAVSAEIVEGGSLSVPLVRTKMDASGVITDDATVQALRSVLAALERAIVQHEGEA
jgi:chromate reductase, NAD(P)H dehydrogenase (quinone)